MRSNRPYVKLDPAVIEQARQMDLLSYLQRYEPSNLKRVAGNVYCTKEHDSLKISNGKWYWWSRGFGGVSALDYLIKVREYSFVEAVEILTGQTMADWKPPPAPKKDEPKVLLLPPKNKDCNRVIQYLFGHYAGRCRTMLVGTGGSTLAIPFYENCGFTYSHRIPDFFTDNYDHPIYEAGKQLKDMVYLKRNMDE